MKLKFSYIVLLFVLIISCTKANLSPEFIAQYSGRYLYNTDELLEVYFEDEKLLINWRGAEKIKPLMIDDSTFFVKEMNKKIQFIIRLSDQKAFIRQVYKDKEDSLSYDFRKLEVNEKIPSEYLANKEYDKALEGYLEIKDRDSLDPAINRRYFNRLGYKSLEEEQIDDAINIFKMNVALNPESYNVYDSLAEAYLVSGDTLQALNLYKKALTLNSGSTRLKEIIKRLENKEE